MSESSTIPTLPDVIELSELAAAAWPGSTVTAQFAPRPVDYDPERPFTVEISGAWGIDHLKVAAATPDEASRLAVDALREARGSVRPEDLLHETTRRVAPDVADALDAGDFPAAASAFLAWLDTNPVD